MATISKKIVITGIGVHSGKPAKLTILPSSQFGIFFKRTDIKGTEIIPAIYNNVFDSIHQNTTIGTAPNTVSTIEHLMAAFFVCGIDSVVVEIDGPETPIMSGGAEEFCKKFINNIKQTSHKTKLIIKKKIRVERREVIKTFPFIYRMQFLINNFLLGRKSDGFVEIRPNKKGLQIYADINFPDKIIGAQSAEFLFNYTDKSRKDFIKNFASARTFGKIKELEYLKKHGMGNGANEHNVIALNENGDGVLNNLKTPDEFVRHKIIDAFGDAALCGVSEIYGTLISYKGSHAMNNMLLRKLFADKSNFEIVKK